MQSKHPDVLIAQDFSKNKVKGRCQNIYPTFKNFIGPELVGFDLCVLASSNHSIHTYGTFGMWGSLLAGGTVVTVSGIGLNETEVGINLTYTVFSQNEIHIL